MTERADPGSRKAGRERKRRDKECENVKTAARGKRNELRHKIKMCKVKKCQIMPHNNANQLWVDHRCYYGLK